MRCNFYLAFHTWAYLINTDLAAEGVSCNYFCILHINYILVAYVNTWKSFFILIPILNISLTHRTFEFEGLLKAGFYVFESKIWDLSLFLQSCHQENDVRKCWPSHMWYLSCVLWFETLVKRYFKPKF